MHIHLFLGKDGDSYAVFHKNGNKREAVKIISEQLFKKWGKSSILGEREFNSGAIQDILNPEQTLHIKMKVKESNAVAFDIEKVFCK